MARELVPIGRLQVATPLTMALAIRAGTEATDAVDERIAPVAGEIIENLDPEIFAGPAEIAVDAKLAESNVLTADLESAATRSNRAAVSMSFQDSSYGVRYPSVYPAIYPAGVWSTPVPRRADLPTLGPDGMLPSAVVPAKPIGVLRELVVQSDPDGPIDFEVRGGVTYARQFSGGGGSTFVPKRCVLVDAIGQSNEASYAHPLVPFLDFVSSRIWQLPYGGDALTPAAPPLTGPGPASGLSPAHVLAREIAANDPECVVVIVPAAVGGSGLVTDPSGGRGKWEVGYTGPNPALYANAVNMTTRAIAQAQARWGLTPTVLATWIHGETDGADGISRAVYQAALDVLINDWRSRFQGMFLIAGMVPGYEPAGTRPEITLALQDTPRRVLGTAFVPGVENGGGSRGPTDTNHYGREAIEIIGREWFKAIPRASDNATGSPTQSPLKVAATRWANTVTVSWTPPHCRVTAYEVQSSTDGTNWTNVVMSEPVATRVAFTSAAPVKVRVRAIGTDTSNWTAPVIAIAG